MADPFQIIVSIVVFAAVLLLVWTLFRFPVRIEPPVQRKVAAALGLEQRQTIFENPVTAPVLAAAFGVSRRLEIPGLRGRVRRDLDASGNPDGYSVDEYLALCIVAAGLTMLGGAIFTWVLAGRVMPMLVMVLTLIGWFAPLWSLRATANARLRRISNKLPYTLDLIALMMGSGSTFTEAVETIIRDEPEDDFNQELRIAAAEIELGAPRAAALLNLVQRIPIESLQSVVGAINQTEQLGTPLSTILSVLARMMRAHRSVRAEKLAASAGLKIIAPTILILGAAILALFGPLIITFVTGGFSFE